MARRAQTNAGTSSRGGLGPFVLRVALLLLLSATVASAALDVVPLPFSADAYKAIDAEVRVTAPH
jgi:hypothetical protein